MDDQQAPGAKPRSRTRLIVQAVVPGRDLTNLDGEPLDQARLGDLWQQVAALRKARIAHRDLGCTGSENYTSASSA